VLARDRSGLERVIIVHRARYDDWSFPKGKQAEGESVEQTALREVREETGLSCRITRALEPIEYRYASRKGNSKEKRVYYFLMVTAAALPDDLKADGEEVDRVEWVEAREALTRLSYEADRQVLGELLGNLLNEPLSGE
jgi:8-oxo-dGTP diphosphatase